MAFSDGGYTEVKKSRQCLDNCRQPISSPPILFLRDEALSGPKRNSPAHSGHEVVPRRFGQQLKTIFHQAISMNFKAGVRQIVQ